MQLKTALAQAAAISTLALAATAVQAETLNFELTGLYSASWQLDSAPVPDLVGSFSFTMWDVPGDFPSAVDGMVDLQFWGAASDGGLTIIDFWGGGVTLADTTGAQLFEGSFSAPTFAIGSYSLQDVGGNPYTLTISAIPEPAAIGLMLAGLGVIGAVARRRREPATA